MGGGYRRSRTHKAKKAFKRQFRTADRAKDLDQIQEELEKKAQGITTFANEVEEYSDADELPGGGKYFCQGCDKYLINQATMDIHVKTKTHKKRVKLLAETPYTHKEAEAAGGVGSNDYQRRLTTKMQS
jgi:bud site selection protein 20